MPPDLGVVAAVVGVLTFTLGLGVLVLRAPRCPGCGRPGVAEARAIADTCPSLVEVVYRCRACDTVVGRRMLGHPGE
jgi:hypothetical protein